ncbi:MAG: zinc-dependent metalloprotease [Planctomycetaceae bacterium]
MQTRLSRLALSAAALVILPGRLLLAQEGGGEEFPPHAKVLEGYEKVITKANIRPMYTLYQRDKDSQIYAELPRNFGNKKYFIALTVASGDPYAGLQSGEMYVYWRRYDKRIALIEPNVQIRATGDKEAEASVSRLFTDRILMDVPIVTIGPGGGPIIDLDDMLVQNAQRFFGSDGVTSSSARYGVYSIARSQAFENNIEVEFEVPSSRGNLKKLHYSISDIPDNTGYKPREADQRVGFFTTTYTDLAKYNDRETRVRYINRWHLEKADPKLQLSPPKNPIVFYIEHTTPVRYRRWVREGILAWNEAFEKVGISDAIEVYYQDQSSGAHMDKDPEDVNYNFVRWLNNDVGTAIGPSRVHPLTGQILDADIILTDGWIRHYQKQFSEMLPATAMEGFGPETLSWLARHPEWDPRIRLAPPAMREQIAANIQRESARPFSGHPIGAVDPKFIGDDEFDGLIGRTSQVNGMCLAAEGMSFDLAQMKMHLALGLPEDAATPEDEKKTHPLDGRWAGIIGGLSAAQFPVDRMPFTMMFTAEGGNLKGWLTFAGQEVALENISFDEATQELKATLKPDDGVDVTLTARLKDGELSGEWVAVKGEMSIRGDWSASKAKPATPSPSPVAEESGDKPKEEAKDEKKDADKKDGEESGDKDKKKDEEKPPGEQMLDGMPESFVGPLIAHLVAHEVGHTLGLRHNFKASSVYTMAEINSKEMKGKKQLAGSVMDYISVNICLGAGEEQGDYSMTGIGPYDLWAIEYGYTFGDTAKILKRVAEPELVFATDEDTGGSDPLARRYDFSKDPLDFAENEMRLATYHRGRLLSDFIKDGESWDRVRYGYELTLSQQTRAVSMMANWVGGAFVYRDKKGDPNGRKPIEVVPAEQQRKALKFVVDSTFRDDVYGLTPELVTAMGLDKWLDDSRSFFDESTWPIHDRIMGIQASTLTMLMNPTTLKRVYDNEFRVPADQDALTLPELLTTVSDNVWSELDEKADGKYSAREPRISSLRRNLQREHMERLVDLTLPGNGSSAASQAISMLSAEELRKVLRRIDSAQAAAADRHDPYTTAHLAQARQRIEKALDADYILNPGQSGGSGGAIIIRVGQDGEQPQE